MPYSDPDKQKQAQHEWYVRRKEAVARGEKPSSRPKAAKVTCPRSLAGADPQIERILERHRRQDELLTKHGFTADEPAPGWGISSDDYGRGGLWSRDLPSRVLCASPDVLPRALRVLHGIVREAHRRSWEVEWFPGRPEDEPAQQDGRKRRSQRVVYQHYDQRETRSATSPTITLVADGQRVDVAVREQLKYVDSTKQTRGGYFGEDESPLQVLRFKGSLEIVVGSRYSGKKIADRVKTQVEQQLGVVFATAESLVERDRQRAQARATEEQERQLAAAERERCEAAVDLEYRRDAAVLQLAAQHHHSGLLRELASALAGSSAPRAKQWRQRAEELADRLSPVSSRTGALPNYENPPPIDQPAPQRVVETQYVPVQSGPPSWVVAARGSRGR